MSTKDELLKIFLLNENQWVSGSQLAQKLSISRESIWKGVDALRKQGHRIESQRSLGYRYLGSDHLDSAVIKMQTKGRFAGEIHTARSIDSTQNWAKQYLSSHQPDRPVAFLADQQTAGYGRRGRQFYSPQKTGLYFSLVLPHNPMSALPKIGLLTTGVAVAVGHVLKRTFPDHDFSYKWVNDIYVNGHKVCGILTEATLELESASSAALIVGIGINLSTADFPNEFAQKAGSIAPGQTVDRNRLAAELLVEIMSIYHEYDSGKFLPEYRDHSLVLNRPVELKIGNRQVVGTAIDIDEQGGLVVELADGTKQSFISGEVTKVNLPGMMS